VATVDDLRQWITANESLLSGTAALVALAGLALLPIGRALRRMIVPRRTDTRVDAGLAPGPDKPGQVAALAVGATGLAAAN
jgi:hypothetical protein